MSLFEVNHSASLFNFVSLIGIQKSKAHLKLLILQNSSIQTNNFVKEVQS